MPLEFTFTCPLPNGVHARPAGSLEEIARPFASSIIIRNERTGLQADAKSVLMLIGADIKLGDACRCSIDGVDGRQAFDAVKRFIESEFPKCDGPLPVLPPASIGSSVPICLQHAGVPVLHGMPVSAGVGRGIAVMAGGLTLPAEGAGPPADDADEQWRMLAHALDDLRDMLAREMRQSSRPLETAVIKAHISIANDPAFREKARKAVFEHRRTAARAVLAAYSHFSAIMRRAESQYLRERVVDLHDVCARLVGLLGATISARIDLSAPSIVVAEELAPSQFLALDRAHLRGLVLMHAGATSHTVLLARSFGIPALVGVADAHSSIEPGSEIVVDADGGIVVPGICAEVERYYSLESRKKEVLMQRMVRAAGVPAATADNVRMEVAANIALAEEAEAVFARGAEGIGLFRTEMLFMDRSGAPSEEEQFEAYRRVALSAGARPVIIRTLDVGGDKPLPYLPLPAESNPFLGFRGVRIYAQFADIVKTQLRAIIRASAFGTVRIMIPMISGIDEVVMVRAMIGEIQADLERRGVTFDAGMQIGIMIEVPAAALAIEDLSAHADFFSIGTNDLAQYFFAVDRGNAAVSHLHNYLAPSFLRLLKKIVDDAHARGKRVGMCGEMGGDARALPLLVGMGLDEISMAAPAIPRTRAALSKLTFGECSRVLHDALACASAAQVERVLADFPRPAMDLPIVAPELILANSDCATKEEAIKALADALFLAERTADPAAVEAAIWQREAVYSTGLGFGFAIPHCKTDLVLANSIAVLKASAPIAWGSLDGNPVNVVILLAVRESDAQNSHMKIFARLARKVMHEEFREFLANASDPEEIRAFIEKHLGIDHHVENR